MKAFIIYYCVCLFLFPLAGESVLKYRYNSSGEQRALLKYSNQEVKIFLNVNEKENLTFIPGIELPFLAAGPYIRSGLLKECYNYSAYSGRSGVFRETTGLKADATLNPSKGSFMHVKNEWGGVAMLFPHKLSPLALLYLSGGIEGLTLEAFGLAAQERKNSGGIKAGALHMGSRFLIDRNHWFLLFSGILNIPPEEGPKALSHLVLSYDSDLLKGGFFFEYSAPGYRTPSGAAGKNLFKWEGSFAVSPVSGGLLEFLYARHIDHPDSEMFAFYPGKELWRLKGRQEIFSENREKGSFNFSLKKEVTYAETGELSGGLIFNALFRYTQRELGTSFSVTMESLNGEAVKGRGGWDFFIVSGHLRLDCSFKMNIFPDSGISWQNTLVYNPGSYRLFIKQKWERVPEFFREPLEKTLSFEIGWDARIF